MKYWTILLLSIAVSACTTTSIAPPDKPVFNDSLFAAPSEYIGADRIFEVSAEMKHFLATEIAPKIWAKGEQQALFDALYAQNQLKLDYDSSMTRTAPQAFEARSGNCLSMAIMTAAMAKQLGLRVEYRRVNVDETWSRVGQTYFYSGHVDVTLRDKPSAVRFNIDRPMTIDFIPLSDLRHYSTEVIDEKTIVAMYMNNRAAESLAGGKLDNAYWWARAAIEQDPTFLNSYNTLGVVYKVHGNFPQAETAFNQALRRQPKDVIVMSNLVPVLSALGRTEEANELNRKVDELRPYPPFHFFNLGREAMKTGDFKTAKNLFKKELDRAPDYHEFQFWYAVACLRLGEIRTADKYMALAMENSTTRKDRDIYAAKLDRLRSLERISRGEAAMH